MSNKKKPKPIIITTLILVLLGGVALSGCKKDGPNDYPSVVNTEMTSTSIQAFSETLFQQALSNPKEDINPILSPTSAYIAMSMVGEGAKSQTLEEFKDVFGVEFGAVSTELLSTLPEDTKNLKIQVANSVWVDNMMDIDKEWKSTITKKYQSEVTQMDLSDDKIVSSINGWVNNHTNGMIKKIIKEPYGDDARLALLNAVYFKGKWEVPFDEYNTCVEDFSLEDGTITQTDMMHLYGEELKSIDGKNYEGVILPYKDSSYTFVAVKPTNNNSVRDMYKKLSIEELTEQIAKARSETINLKLPKFKIEYERTLSDDFMNMGLTTAFTGDKAEFSGIGVSKDGLPLYISSVRQKAAIEVNEEGTEAAAVTIVEMNVESAAIDMEEPREIFFDQPFFYMIYDAETQIPLFMGIFDEPV